MIQFFRMVRDSEGNDALKTVGVCEIQGRNIPDMPEEFEDTWFTLGTNSNHGDGIMVNWDVDNVSEEIANMVVRYVNNVSDKKSLSTLFRRHILLNGEEVPHYDLVYVAETEQEVWDYLNSL